jgi:hypothetical protein
MPTRVRVLAVCRTSVPVLGIQSFASMNHRHRCASEGGAGHFFQV